MIENEFKFAVQTYTGYEFIDVTPHVFSDGAKKYDLSAVHDAVTRKYAVLYVFVNVKNMATILSDLALLDWPISNLRRANIASNVQMVLDYLPFGRDDRKEGNTTVGLASFCNLIRYMGLKALHVLDPHNVENTKSLILDSDTREGFYPHYIDYKSLTETLDVLRVGLLVAPDAGAIGRVNAAADSLKLPVLLMEKTREEGRVSTADLQTQIRHLRAEHVMLIDDICDYGGTFIKASKTLKEAGIKKVSLCVSHLLAPEGLDKILEHIDYLFVANVKNPDLDNDPRIIYCKTSLPSIEQLGTNKGTHDAE